MHAPARKTARLLSMRGHEATADLDLVLMDTGEVGVIWAGCFYGPAKDIAEVVNGETLRAAKAFLGALRRKPDFGRLFECFEPDDGLGIRFLQIDHEPNRILSNLPASSQVAGSTGPETPGAGAGT